LKSTDLKLTTVKGIVKEEENGSPENSGKAFKK
jgi:hypothetical protein